jgi:hypothetical protein
LSKREQRSQLELTSGVLVHFQSMIPLCVGRIKAALKNRFPSLEDVLAGSVMITATQEVVVNAYEENHLSGILHILHAKYRKANFVTMSSMVTKLFSWKLPPAVASVNPAAAHGQMTKLHQTWTRHKYQELFTEDIMFAFLVAMGLPEGSECRKAALEAVDKERLAQSTGKSLYLGDPMPVFRAVGVDLEAFEYSARFVGKGPAAPAAAVPAANPAPSSLYNGNARQRARISNVEFAATAEEALAVQTPPALPNHLHTQSKERYNTEIPASMRKVCGGENGSKTHKYVAVRERASVCAECYGPNPVPHANGNGGTCFAMQCNKCQFFGHRAQYCRQSLKADGSKLA